MCALLQLRNIYQQQPSPATLKPKAPPPPTVATVNHRPRSASARAEVRRGAIGAGGGGGGGGGNVATQREMAVHGGKRLKSGRDGGGEAGRARGRDSSSSSASDKALAAPARPVAAYDHVIEVGDGEEVSGGGGRRLVAVCAGGGGAVGKRASITDLIARFRAAADADEHPRDEVRAVCERFVFVCAVVGLLLVAWRGHTRAHGHEGIGPLSSRVVCVSTCSGLWVCMSLRVFEPVSHAHESVSRGSWIRLPTVCQMDAAVPHSTNGNGNGQTVDDPALAHVAQELASRKAVSETTRPRDTSRRPQSAVERASRRVGSSEGQVTSLVVGALVDGVAGEACASRENRFGRMADDLGSVLARVGAGAGAAGGQENGDLLERWRSERRARREAAASGSPGTGLPGAPSVWASCTAIVPPLSSAAAAPAAESGAAISGGVAPPQCSRAKRLKRRLAGAGGVRMVEEIEEVSQCERDGGGVAVVGARQENSLAVLLKNGGSGPGDTEAAIDNDAISRIRRRLCGGEGGVQAERSGVSGAGGAQGYAQRMRGRIVQRDDDREGPGDGGGGNLCTPRAASQDSDEKSAGRLLRHGSSEDADGGGDDYELGIVRDDEEGSFDGEEGLLLAASHRPRKSPREQVASVLQGQPGGKSSLPVGDAKRDEEAGEADADDSDSSIVPVLLPAPTRFSKRAVAGKDRVAAAGWEECASREWSEAGQDEDRPCAADGLGPSDWAVEHECQCPEAQAAGDASCFRCAAVVVESCGDGEGARRLMQSVELPSPGLPAPGPDEPDALPPLSAYLSRCLDDSVSRLLLGGAGGCGDGVLAAMMNFEVQAA